MSRITHVKRPLVAIAGIGAVLSGLAGWWNAYSTIHTASTASSAPTVPTVGLSSLSPIQKRLSIVVMPFVNLTGDASNDHVADSLTESVTAEFARIHDSYVVPSSTAHAYQEKKLTAQQLGQALGIAYAVSGSIQGSGSTLRVTAQLVDAQTGAQIWGQSFDADSADAITFLDRVTVGTRRGANAALIVHAARAAEKRPGPQTAADLKLRARALLLQPLSEALIRQEESLLRQALALEPDDLSAQIDLAFTLQNLADWERSEQQREQRAKHLSEARQLAAHASAVNPESSSVCALNGALAMADREVDFARQTFERCSTLDPTSPGILSALAMTYVFDGVEGAHKAMQLMNRAIAFRGTHVDNNYLINLGLARLLSGDSNGAIEPLETALHLNPDVSDAQCYLAMAYADVGKTARRDDIKAKIVALNAPGFGFKAFEAYNSIDTPGYRTLREQRIRPLWRKAGLPD